MAARKDLGILVEKVSNTHSKLTSPTNKDIRGRKIDNSAEVQISTVQESVNSGKFPSRVNLGIKKCTSQDRLRSPSHESRGPEKSLSRNRFTSLDDSDFSRSKHLLATVVSNMSRKKLRTMKKHIKNDDMLGNMKTMVKSKITPNSLKSPSRSNIKSPNRVGIDIKQEMKESLRKLQEGKKLRILEEERKRRKRTEVTKFNDEIRKMNEPIVNKSPKRKKKKSLQELIPKMVQPIEQPSQILQRKKSLPKNDIPPSNQKKRENLAEIPNSLDAGTNKGYLLKNVLSHKVSQKLQKQATSKSKEKILPSKGAFKQKKTEERIEEHFPKSILKKIEQYQTEHSAKGLLRLGKSFKSSKKNSKTSEERSRPLKELKASQIDVKRNKSPKSGSKGGKKKKTQKRFFPSGDDKQIIDTDMANTRPVFNFKKEKRSIFEINAKNKNDNNFSESSMSRDGGERSVKNKPKQAAPGKEHYRKKVSESLLEISDYIEADPDKVIAEMIEKQSTSRRKLDSEEFEHQPIRTNRSHPKSLSQAEILLEQFVEREQTPRPETMIDLAAKSKDKADSQKGKEEIDEFIDAKSDRDDLREPESIVIIEKPMDLSALKSDPLQTGNDAMVSAHRKSVAEQSEPSKEHDKELRNSSVVEKLAKDQFLKWTEIGNMIQQIESKLGAKAAIEMQELLVKVEKFTEQSRQGLKEKYLRDGDRNVTSNPWELKSRRSEDQALRYSLNESDYQGELKKLREDNSVSVGSKKINRMFKKDEMEIWPETNIKMKSLSNSPSSINPNSFIFKANNSGRREKSQTDNDHVPFNSDRQGSSRREKPVSQKTVGIESNGWQSQIKVMEDFQMNLDHLDGEDTSPVIPRLLVDSIIEDLPENPDRSREEQNLSVREKNSQDDINSLDMNKVPVTDLKDSGVPSQNIEKTEQAQQPSLASPELPGKYTPNAALKKYVENSTLDMNWLVGDRGEQLEEGKDGSFEEEVKSCRKLFLADTITDMVLNDLLNEVKNEQLYFKQQSRLSEQLLSMNFLENIRYTTESSEGDTIYGIRTNMNAVNEYCNLLVRFIIDNYMEMLVEKFNKKKETVPFEALNSIRRKEIEVELSDNHWEEFERGTIKAAEREFFLPEVIFTSLEDEIVSNYDNMNILPDLFQMQKVYHKSIYDTFNEVITSRWLADEDIDYFKVIIHNKQYHSRSLVDPAELEKLIVACRDSVLEYSSLLCGIIRDKEDSMIGNIKFMELERVNMIREERLFRFLCLEALETERQWINYSKEEVMALVDCSDKVFDFLLLEFVRDFKHIQTRAN